MKTHYNKTHKALEIQSPLGKFPASDPARILFDESGEPSTQGNSAGQVNSPKVISTVSFQCGYCELPFDTNDKAILHMKEDHTNKAASASAPAPSPNPNPTSSPTPEQLPVDNSAEELN